MARLEGHRRLSAITLIMWECEHSWSNSYLWRLSIKDNRASAVNGGSLIHICSWLPSVALCIKVYLQSWDPTCWMVFYFFTYDLFSSFAVMRDMMKFMPNSTFNAALMLTKSSSDHLHQPVSPYSSLLNRGQFVCFHKFLVNINCVKKIIVNLGADFVIISFPKSLKLDTDFEQEPN